MGPGNSFFEFIQCGDNVANTDVLGARVSAEELEDIIGRVLHLQAA